MTCDHTNESVEGGRDKRTGRGNGTWHRNDFAMGYEGSAGLVCWCMSLTGRDWTLFPHLLILGERRPLRRLPGPSLWGISITQKVSPRAFQAGGLLGVSCAEPMRLGKGEPVSRRPISPSLSGTDCSRLSPPIHQNVLFCPNDPTACLVFSRPLQSLASPLPLHPVCTL